MFNTTFSKIALITLTAAVIIAGGIMGSSALLSRLSLNLRQSSVHETEKTVTVKGVAEKEVVSDLGSFNISISCRTASVAGDNTVGTSLADGYNELEKITVNVLSKLKEYGIADHDISVNNVRYSAVDRVITTKNEANKALTKSESVFDHYYFCRSIRVVTKDVYAMQNAALKLNGLIAENIDISIDNIQFFLSNPEQFKLELVDAATQSAYQRANIMAIKSGAELGALLTARQGVIQITRPASNETSDYGMYDTSSIKKTMRLVVTLEFSLRQ